MLSATPFGVLLQFGLAPAFMSNEQQIAFDLMGHRAVLKAKGKSLAEAPRATISIDGFVSESAARQFAEPLQDVAAMAALKANLGIDVETKPPMYLNPEITEIQLYKYGVYLRPVANGVHVFPKDYPTLWSESEGPRIFTVPPQSFLEELNTAYRTWRGPLSENMRHALHLRVQAQMGGDSLAEFVLAIASVEALTPDEFWNNAQRKALDDVAAQVRSMLDLSANEIDEIVERITKQRKLSVNQGFRRLFDRLGLAHIRRDWDRVYSIRSKVLHGDASLNEGRRAVHDARRLSKTIVLAAYEHGI